MTGKIHNRLEKIRRYTGSLQLTPPITQLLRGVDRDTQEKIHNKEGKIHSSSATV